MSEELLAAAIQDAKEAEAYASELEVENKALVKALEVYACQLGEAERRNLEGRLSPVGVCAQP